MSDIDKTTAQKQECPYYFYLTRKLQRELEHERELRVEAEMRSKPLFALSFVLLALLAIGITFCFVCGSMDGEVLRACVHLTCACAALFFSFAFALLAVNYTLDHHAKRQQEKNADKKKEGK